jgi:hypothetical protein
VPEGLAPWCWRGWPEEGAAAAALLLHVAATTGG